jgi:hypothetical protein
MRETAAELRDVGRGATAVHKRLRDRLLTLLVATLGIDVICAALALLFEHHAPQTQIKSYWDAFFWTSTQLLTVSSSFQNPLTTGGRILDIGMEAYAVTVVASLAGSLGAFMVKRGREREQRA